jgi:hypothetical protein
MTDALIVVVMACQWALGFWLGRVYERRPR